MTKRERLLSVFADQTPDRLPWVADVGYWMAARNAEGTLPQPYAADGGYLRLHNDFGLCAYYSCGVRPFCEEFDGLEIEDRQDGAVTRTTYRIPEGELVAETTSLPGSCCSAITKHPVETLDDLRVLRAMFERMTIHPNLEAYRACDGQWGDDGYAGIYLLRTPLPKLLAEWTGLMNLAYLIADAPDEMAHTLEVIAQASDPAFRICAQARFPLVHFIDNLSSENVTGYFDCYMRRYFERWLEGFHEAGVASVNHLDGTIRGLLPKLAEVGFDGVESLTPMPVGDVAVDELRALAGRDDFVLWGGVPGAMFAPPFTKDDMRRHVRHVLDTCGHEPFVLGTADQIPPDGDIHLCEMIAEMVETFVP